MKNRKRVWAPNARVVEVELQGRVVPFESRGEGVFEIDAAKIDGAYRLRLDGDVVPDPWAEDVESVLGPCHLVDHEKFAWTDAGFRPTPLDEGVIYELHVGTFSSEGTFDGAAKKLPYLVGLGITHVELMPLATFSGERNWGYDGASLFAPHRAYGGAEGLRRFVDAAHALGVAVLLDVVYNHLGPIGNFLDRFGPFFREDRHTPWGRAVNFDGRDSDEVRRFFTDNALGWLENYHIDGLRLDAVHAIEDYGAIPFLEELENDVARLGAKLKKPLVLIAESDLNDPRLIADSAHGGFGLDAQWCDDFHHALHVVLTGEDRGYYADFSDQPLTKLGRALTDGYVYAGQHSNFRRRRHGRPLGEIARTRLVGYAQTHDQIGNRAQGDRLSQLVGPAAQRLAETLVFTAPFIPMLFMGEEWGASTPFLFFTDHREESIAKATREGRRREFVAFGWRPEEIPDPQDVATFEKSILRWDEIETGPHADTLAYVKKLIALRRAEPALRDGRPEHTKVQVDEAARTLVVERGTFSVYLNFGKSTANFPLRSDAKLVLAAGEATMKPPSLELSGESSAIVQCA